MNSKNTHRRIGVASYAAMTLLAALIGGLAGCESKKEPLDHDHKHDGSEADHKAHDGHDHDDHDDHAHEEPKKSSGGGR